MNNLMFLKLRSNIMIPTDVLLAERECRSFFGKMIPANCYEEVNNYLPIGQEHVLSFAREKPPIGFVGIDCISNLHELITSLSFIQEVWVKSDNKLAQSLQNDEIWFQKINTPQGTFICAIPLMSAAEFLSYVYESEISEKNFVQIVDCLSSGKRAEKSQVGKKAFRRITSAPHVHGLHRYKAKFFPRMIRSFITSNRNRLPPTNSGKVILVDPFVGSGTAIVESILLARESIGIDIDLLSCAITKAKLRLMQINVDKLRRAVEKTISNYNLSHDVSIQFKYSFPPWIAKKFSRWGTCEEQKKYEKEIALWLKAISKADFEEAQEILKICLSDAITRKFNIRMMGTGVGRFALEIRKRELSSIMKANLRDLVHRASVVHTLKRAYSLNFPPSNVFQGTATNMQLPNESVSIVLTSPPYLPASSGRESYLISKSISITSLGLMTTEEICEMETRSIGSMKTTNSADMEDVPNDVKQLFKWLNSDELRKIKAKPSLVYYKELKNALLETYRILVPGGLAIYVIGKESIFYRYKSRKILYKVECDRIFQEIAEQCGFNIDERIDVELDKKNRNARPRSLDAFYETVFVLRKP